MIVGVIGSGSIGPDLAYGFISAIAGAGGKVYLHDIKQEALDAGAQRIQGYVKKGLARGKLHPKVAKAIGAGLVPTLELGDLADCDYVLEAATEDLAIKKVILKGLEDVVGPDCLIGFATSGLPRAQIAAEAKHPDRCFVNHPFFPAWRALPIEVVLSDDAALGDRMLATLKGLGKVPIVTKDVHCFAADDIFVNYCAEAARIVAEGTATPAQVDAIVNKAIGGGGPFNVMDLTRGNLLNVHCLELMLEAHEDNAWFTPPPIFTEQGNDAWHDRKNPGDASHDEALKDEVLDRMLAVLLGRTCWVADQDICERGALDWMTRNALGFRKGLLTLAEDLGPERVNELCTRYAARFDGFDVTPSIADKAFPEFYRHIVVGTDGDIGTVTICRPEVKNALSDAVMAELADAIGKFAADDAVKGIVLTSFDGAIAGADINELAALKTPEEADAKCRRGHAIMDAIAAVPKPIVAALDGPVLGGGSELSMACHARVVGKHLMVGQPEVNLGIIPGYGGTQRLPRLIGLERGLDLLRTGRPVFAKHACKWGWAHGEPVDDIVAGAKALIGQHLEGKVTLGPVDPAPMEIPAELPNVDIGHHSIAIDEVLVEVCRVGLAKSLTDGLVEEAKAFGFCKTLVDYDIGMTNFIVNGPRVQAAFLHE